LIVGGIILHHPIFIGSPWVLKVRGLTSGDSEEECERWVGIFLVEDDFKSYGSLLYR